MSEDPVRVAKRSQRISAKVCRLQARRTRACYAEGVLEVLVQGIDETVREALSTG
jgi:hypothetical protein